MLIKRQHVAILCILAFLALAPLACQADGGSPVYVHVTAGGRPLNSGALAVFVNGTQAGYVGDNTYEGAASDNSTADVSASYNGYCVSGTVFVEGRGDASLDFSADQVKYVVRGTIYSVSSLGRSPWLDEHEKVLVNGVPASIDGYTYTATLYAPGEGDPIDVKVVHDSGYVLGEASGRVDLVAGSANVDVDVQALEVSGDVFMDDVPADGATLFVYVNDRPHGPVTAIAAMDNGTLIGPMFLAVIPGAHPGDHVTLTASKGDGVGVVTQGVLDYRVFLTVNLKNVDTYVPYSDAQMPSQPDPAVMPAGPADQKGPGTQYMLFAKKAWEYQ